MTSDAVDRTVCMPTLSLSGLTLLSACREGRTVRICFDRFPRYLRVGSRIFGIPERRIITAIEAILPVVLVQVVHGDGVPGYGDAHLGSQEAAAEVSPAFLGALRKDPWTVHMASLYGEEPALSYLLKHLANEHLFPYLLLTAAFHCSGGRRGSLRIWAPVLPSAWIAEMERQFDSIPLRFYRVPAWYRWILSWRRGIGLLAGLCGAFLLAILRRPNSIGERAKKGYKVISEFIDPLRLSGGPHDADFFVDGVDLRPQEVLFFLTDAQAAQLRSLGYDIPRMIADMSGQRGYDIRRTADYPLGPTTLKLLLRLLGSSLSCFRNCGRGVCLFEYFAAAWREYLEFSPMFEHCRADALLYSTFPNGRSSIRFNSGILTSLCRREGIRSVHYQSRATHSKNYEYNFDCSDLHLAWGRRWCELLGEGTRFMKRMESVGCLYLPRLLSTAAGGSSKERGGMGPMVGVFPSDINLDGRHHYTLEYSLRFMRCCARLALQHPGVRFLIKSKEPRYSEIVEMDREFRGLLQSSAGNMSFFNMPRHDYADLLCASDIVLAVGYTTPGAEALLLGKRVIFYDELRCGGQAFSGIANLVARDAGQMDALFHRALTDWRTFGAAIEPQLISLDPYRDPGVQKRIRNALFHWPSPGSPLRL